MFVLEESYVCHLGGHMHQLDGCGCMQEKDFRVGIWGLRGSYYIKSVFKFNLC